MLPRAVLLRRLRAPNASAHLLSSLRPQRLTSGALKFSSSAPTSNETKPSTSQSSKVSKSVPESEQQASWLTRKVESSPAAKKVFLGLAKALGYGSPKQLAARRAFVLYEKIAATRPEGDVAFWQNGAVSGVRDVDLVLIFVGKTAICRQRFNPGSP